MCSCRPQPSANSLGCRRPPLASELSSSGPLRQLLGQHRLIGLHRAPDDQALEAGGILARGDPVPGPDWTRLRLHRANFQVTLHIGRPVTFMCSTQQRLGQHLGVRPTSAGLQPRVDPGYDLLRLQEGEMEVQLTRLEVQVQLTLLKVE